MPRNFEQTEVIDHSQHRQIRAESVLFENAPEIVEAARFVF